MLSMLAKSLGSIFLHTRKGLFNKQPFWVFWFGIPHWQIHVFGSINWTNHQFWGWINFELQCSKVEKRDRPHAPIALLQPTEITVGKLRRFQRKSNTKNNSFRLHHRRCLLSTYIDDMFKKSWRVPSLHPTERGPRYLLFPKKCGKLRVPL